MGRGFESLRGHWIKEPHLVIDHLRFFFFILAAHKIVSYFAGTNKMIIFVACILRPLFCIEKVDELSGRLMRTVVALCKNTIIQCIITLKCIIH